jgi:transcriptional regulator with XRE-family HTH domain
MTLGQRVAQKRKELGLSQEALGEQLGVSRQSIYKWESDAALPEIEKLLALSRLFGVSVGWLLGAEDEPSTQDTAAPETGSGELTETQLKMVQEIVDRYLAALPPPPKRRRWPWVLAAVAAVFAVFNLFSYLKQLDQRYSTLQNSVYNVTSSVDRQISTVSDRVEEILKAQNSLTADYGVEIDSMNLLVGRVTFEVYAVPKTYVDGMQVEFFADYDEGKSVPGSWTQTDEKFYGEIRCPLTDSITVSVQFLYPDGTRQTQLLEVYTDLYSQTLPRLNIYDDFFFAAVEDGVLHIPQADGTPVQYVYAQPDTSSASTAAIASVRMGLFKNQKLLAWAEPCDQPDSFQGFEEYDFYQLPDMDIPMGKGDTLCVAAVVTDEYGRETVSADLPLEVVSDDRGDYLQWLDDSSTSTDLADWQYA